MIEQLASDVSGAALERTLSVLKNVMGSDVFGDVHDSLSNSAVVKRLSQIPVAKMARVAFGALNIMLADPAGADPNRALQQLQTMLSEGQGARAREMETFLAQPGIEKRDSVFARTKESVEALRAQYPWGAQRNALELVLSNVFEKSTSPLLSGLDDESFAKGARLLAIENDVPSLLKKSNLDTLDGKKAFLQAVHDVYAHPQLRAIQTEVMDSRLLFHYEVLFRAYHEPEYEREHWDLVTEALTYFGEDETGISSRREKLEHALKRSMLDFTPAGVV